MNLPAAYIAENEDVIRRSTLYVMEGHDPDKYENLIAFVDMHRKPALKILSVGCSGYEPLLYGATHALDVSQVAGYHLKENGWVGEFTVGSVTSLPYADNEFDVAVCSEVVEHLLTDVDVELAFSEISRVARNWLITTPASPLPEATHKRFWDLVSASSWASRYGAQLTVVNLWYFIFRSEHSFVPLVIPATSGPNASIRPGEWRYKGQFLPVGAWHG